MKITLSALRKFIDELFPGQDVTLDLNDYEDRAQLALAMGTEVKAMKSVPPAADTAAAEPGDAPAVETPPSSPEAVVLAPDAEPGSGTTQDAAPVLETVKGMDEALAPISDGIKALTTSMAALADGLKAVTDALAAQKAETNDEVTLLKAGLARLGEAVDAIRAPQPAQKSIATPTPLMASILNNQATAAAKSTEAAGRPAGVAVPETCTLKF